MLYNKFIDDQIIETYYILKKTKPNLIDSSIQLIFDYILTESNILERLQNDYDFYHIKYILGSNSKDNLIELY